MPIPLSAPEVLEQEFLGVRARIVELAASLDRLNRAEGGVDDDPRLAQIHEALEALHGDQPDRAQRVQMIFSLAYEKDWQREFGFAS